MHILAFAKQTSGYPSALTNFSPQNNVPSLKHMLQTLNMRRFLHSHPIPHRWIMNCSVVPTHITDSSNCRQLQHSCNPWWSSVSPEFKVDTDMCNSKLHICWKPLISSQQGGWKPEFCDKHNLAGLEEATWLRQTQQASLWFTWVQEHPQTDLPLRSELISATVQSLDPTNVFSLAFLEGAKGKPHCTTI
jgi:hypothetical protein